MGSISNSPDMNASFFKSNSLNDAFEELKKAKPENKGEQLDKILSLINNKEDLRISVDDTFLFKKTLTDINKDLSKEKSSLKDTCKKISKLITHHSASAVLQKGTSFSPVKKLDPSFATRHANIKEREKLFMSLNEKIETMKEMGGERRVIVGKEGRSVDGVLFTVDGFRSNIQEKGGKFVSIDLGTESFKGIKIDQNKGIKIDQNKGIKIDQKKQKELLKLMDKMELFKSGWTKVETSQGLFIVKNANAKTLENADKKGLVNSSAIAEAKLSENLERPTILISPGKDGNYEFYLKQVAALAMEGVNVRVYNYSGQGESRGQTVTDESRLEDIRMVYEDLKSHGHSEKSIILQGVCVGGGPTSDLAASITSSGKDVNIMLIKTPANYITVAKMLTKNLMNPIVTKFAKELYIPKYDVADKLEGVRGHKLIVSPKGDAFANKGHLKRIQESLKLNHEEAEHILTTIEPEGKHNFSWHRDQETKSGMLDWLKQVSEKQELEFESVL